MRTMNYKLVAIVLTGALLAACTPADTSLPKDVTLSMQAPFNRGDTAGAAEVYADDAQILPSNHAPSIGRAAIDAFIRDAVNANISLGFVPAWSVVRADLAVEQGTYHIRNVKVGMEVERGTYVHVWKNIGGHWRLYRDMFYPELAWKGSVTVTPAPKD